MKKIIFEEQGYFWWSDEDIPPENFASDVGVTGALKIDETGWIELELHDVLTPNADWIFHLSNDQTELPPHKGIQGILKSNKYVLLLEVFRNGGSFKSSGVSYEKFSALNCLIGSRLFPSTSTPIKFRSLLVSLKGYESWLRIGSIESQRTKKKLSAVYRPPKNDTYNLDDGKLEIQYDLYGPFWGKQSRHEMTLTEEASIAYFPKAGCSLETAKEQYRNLADLMVLLTGADYGFDWPTLSYGSKKEETRCTAYFWSQKRGDLVIPDWHKCWTSFPALRPFFGDVFSNWRVKRDQFGPGFYLYLSTKRDVSLYAEHKFVSLVWGLESLHRRKAPKGILNSKLAEKVDRILSQVAVAKDRNWLKAQLKYVGEPSLSERLYEILKNSPLSFTERSLRKFCDECAKLRNDISHFGGQRHSGGYQPFLDELVLKSSALSYIYHAVLLDEVGVDRADITHYLLKGFGSFSAKQVLAKVGLQWVERIS